MLLLCAEIEAEKMCREFWDANKYNDDVLDQKINELQRKSKTIAVRNPVLDAFQKRNSHQLEVVSHAADASDRDSEAVVELDPTFPMSGENSGTTFEPLMDDDVGMLPVKPPRPKPKREELNEAMKKEREERKLLRQLKEKGFGLSIEQSNRLKDLMVAMTKKKKNVKILEKNRLSQAKARVKKARDIRELRARAAAAADESVVAADVVEPPKGRRRVEREQPGLLNAILDVVNCAASADERRRTETLRACKTLGSLLNELKNMGK